MTAPALYMLDTNICSFAMRHHAAVRDRLIGCAERGDQVVISAIVYSELKDGVLGPKAPAKLAPLLTDFLRRLDGVLAWDQAAVDRTAGIRADLRGKGEPISPNDSAIAGHALAVGAILATNNVREFGRVAALRHEDWTARG
ncbi:MAG: type II toxin-antitoxin system VapC family toxin [Bifidobacteriaceae bacterium]|jgi:tRNA(fMet)-specific endonuclease VapC|nr:type II toxin-antitoxin system VapC family toxin [Bifidobacteriaceae bacterium]